MHIPAPDHQVTKLHTYYDVNTSQSSLNHEPNNFRTNILT
jgi:hypothetical protein